MERAGTIDDLSASQIVGTIGPADLYTDGVCISRNICYFTTLTGLSKIDFSKAPVAPTAIIGGIATFADSKQLIYTGSKFVQGGVTSGKFEFRVFDESELSI